MHPQPLNWISRIRAARPSLYVGAVAECGALDMNGSTRNTVLADHESWVGVDWRAGKGVDVVSVFHEWDPGEGVLFDTLVQTEVAEHDKDWRETLAKCVKLLKPGGNLFFTCAARARPVHEKHVGRDEWYQGLDLVDVVTELRRLAEFDEIICAQNVSPADTYVAALGKRVDTGWRSRPLLTAVIPACQDRYAPRCIKTHSDLSAGVSEYILVVNGADPNAEEVLLRTPGPSVLAFYDVPLGFPEACNVGIALRHPAALAVALVNDDTEQLIYEWDDRVLTILTQEGNIGALSPVLGKETIANPYQWQGVVPTPEMYDVQMLFFAWTAFPVTALETVGPFDPRFGLGTFEDVDYCLRLTDAGLRLVVDPVLVVYHRKHGTFGTLPAGQFKAVMQNSERVLRAKWGARIASV